MRALWIGVGNGENWVQIYLWYNGKRRCVGWRRGEWGIAIKGHIPERDGIWMGIVLWEFMAKSGKTLKELIAEVYEITGPFAFERVDLQLEEAVKLKVVENCKAGTYTAFGKYKVIRMEDMDGWKYFISEDSWIMIRASGTEPVLRTYAEADTSAAAFAMLAQAKKTLLG